MESATTDDARPLEAEVAACLPILPLLSAQLTDVVRHVEDSVVEVCAGFQSLVERARETVAQSRCVVADHAGDSSVGALIAETRETLGSLLKRIEHASHLSAATAQKLQAIEARTAEIETNLLRVDKIAQHARLVALNGSIEAARAGEHGAAFSIVAQETSKLAEHAGQTSKVVRGIVSELNKATRATSTELKQRAEADLAEADQSRREVEHTLDVLTAAHQRMQDLVEKTTEAGQDLASDISRSVMAMQFQDAVSQRVMHVVGVLDEIEQTLATRLADAPAPAVSHDWLDRVSTRYVMAAQREVHARQVSGGAAVAGQFGDNVELF